MMQHLSVRAVGAAAGGFWPDSMRLKLLVEWVSLLIPLHIARRAAIAAGVSRRTMMAKATTTGTQEDASDLSIGSILAGRAKKETAEKCGPNK